MVYEPQNSNNTVEITDGSNTLIIEDGVPVNGTVLRNDFETGEFYEETGQQTPFSGTLNIETGVFTDEGGSTVATVYTSIIENGAPLTSLAYEKGLAPLIPWGKHIVTICVLLFGVSTAISWSYYGDRAIQYLAGDNAILPYKVVYLIMHFFGAIFPLATVWAIGDIALGLMTFPNIIALFALSGSVAVASKKYFDKMETWDADNA
jgi:AGCS family alanine or glycine:cation symporter